MSSLFDSLSDELFQILKGSGRTLTLYGKDGNRTYEPKNARRVFSEPDKMMVSVNEQGSDSEVKIYLSSGTDVRAISSLINTLRSIAARYSVILNVRKFGRELKPKDFAYQATVTEASMWGSAKTSYQKFGNTKLIVRHCLPVSEGVIGARGRNILSMFVETKEGERFKFPENHLSAGRAFAQHINQGGKPHDQTGTDLATLALESLQLARVSRYIHHGRNVLGEEALALRPTIKGRIDELRKNFLSMARPRGYHKISEAGMPVSQNQLNESADDRLASLAELLQINSNHALAESLLPVALLLGENMNDTMNEMFNGVINLGASELDALVEALASEYGHDGETWSHMGESIGFTDGAVFEDAQDFLNMMEATYQINEEDAISNYATQWTLARYRATGEEGGMDKDQQAGISELTDGLRKIFAGDIDMPDYPWDQEPSFRDDNARIRFFLDLFVAQHKLANAATLNYVATLIDKMAEGQKLDGAEKTIAMKLYKALEADIDLGEGIVDESDFPYDDRDDAKYESELRNIVDYFDVDAYLKDSYPFIQHGEEKDTPLDEEEMVTEIEGIIGYHMDNAGYQAPKGKFKNEAHDVFAHVKEVCEARGYTFTSTVAEFAEADDEPGHHGFAAGDNVGTDFGPAQIDSVEGDIAFVHFLHGGSKQLHVDDLDKVPELAETNEEGELSRWFKSYTPEAVLGIGQIDEFATDPFTMGKMASRVGKSAQDCPYNPESQDGDAWLRGLHGMTEPGVSDIDEDDLNHRSISNSQAKWYGPFRSADDATDDAIDNISGGGDPTPTEGVNFSIGKDDRGFFWSETVDGLDEDEMPGPTYFRGGLNGDQEDFINAVAARYGWSVEGQARSILDGEEFEEQNSNALRYIMEIAQKRGEDELVASLRDYLAMCESQVNEISASRREKYFNDGATDRARAERAFHRDGDEEAGERMKRRDRGLSRAFSKMREDIMAEGVTLPEGALDKIFEKVRDLAAKVLADPNHYGCPQPVGQDDVDEENSDFMRCLAQVLTGELERGLQELGYGELGITYPTHESLDEAPVDLYHSVFVKNDDGSYAHHFDADSAADAKEERDYLKRQGDKPLIIKVPKDQARWGQGEGYTDPDTFVKAHLADKEEKIGGDMGQNMIDQTKVTHEAVEEVDENAELAALLKNAMFRL